VNGSRRARILAIANQKGGVAKTTTAITVASALAERGQRVLVVDLDAQACASFSLGIDPEDLPRDATPFLGNTASIVSTAEGVDLLPATSDLARADHALASRSGRERLVRDHLEPMRSDYDWILIDCSPSLGIMTINALVAADDVLIPVHCETLSHRGVGQLTETVEEVRRWANPDLRVLGILPTLFDGRTAHARAIRDDLAERYGVPVFAPIPRSVRAAEAPATGRTVLATAPTSGVAAAYRNLAEVLLA
jgi:chromosome partitioning protein